ncbi:MAG: DUF503 domain-containing protein [Kiritimatiellae bacterium]|jgi:uncharacterized protein YlxP (DUF503 family)|nr:DUF503 domain-containing protein [Kiritimatiellia bacterium]
MFVGSLEVRLFLRGSQTLKEKRQVVRSLLERIRNHHQVSANEVAHRDDVRQIVVGFATVQPDSQTATEVLRRIENALRCHPEAQFLSARLDVRSFEDFV